jgi:TPR repeat protein
MHCPDCDGLLAVCIATGIGCPKSHSDALTYATGSASKKSICGYYAAGMITTNMSTRPENILTAREYLTRASNQGYHRATLFLARFMRYKLMDYNSKEVIRLLQLAITQGSQHTNIINELLAFEAEAEERRVEERRVEAEKGRVVME